jgi:hypothetical protein
MLRSGCISKGIEWSIKFDTRFIEYSRYTPIKCLDRTVQDLSIVKHDALNLYGMCVGATSFIENEAELHIYIAC